MVPILRLSEDVLAFDRWRYAKQVAHGVNVRMAVLAFLHGAAA